MLYLTYVYEYASKYRIRNSIPNQITITISRWYNAESISSPNSLSGIVENTLRPKHKNTIKNLKVKKKYKFYLLLNVIYVWE